MHVTADVLPFKLIANILHKQMKLWEYGLALALVTWQNIIIQRAVNWGIQLYDQLKTN